MSRQAGQNWGGMGQRAPVAGRRQNGPQLAERHHAHGRQRQRAGGGAWQARQRVARAARNTMTMTPLMGIQAIPPPVLLIARAHARHDDSYRSSSSWKFLSATMVRGGDDMRRGTMGGTTMTMNRSGGWSQEQQAQVVSCSWSVDDS